MSGFWTFHFSKQLPCELMMIAVKMIFNRFTYNVH